MGRGCFLFDETGSDWTSIAFSKELESRKDQGCPHMVFLIGGADGYTDEMKQAYSGQDQAWVTDLAT